MRHRCTVNIGRDGRDTGIQGEFNIEMPHAAAEIIHRLEDAGYEAYIVGGCVRDAILGREPEDWDITTSALPLQVKALFRRTIDTGIQHGTVTVMYGGKGYEVTTFRLDGIYEDSRHPVSVEFTDRLTEDLRRRDFTINAMAYSDRRGLVDEFGGVSDLKEGIIRSVGCAADRFGEDALRILRAFRFAAQLGFTVDEETLQAAEELAPTLSRISKERINIELSKLLISDHPGYLRLLYQSGITKVILPEFDVLMDTPQYTPWHCCTAGEHTVRAVEAIEPELTLRLTMLLHDIAKGWTGSTDGNGISHFYGHARESAQWAEKWLRDMKYDNQTVSRVTRLISYHDYRIDTDEVSVRRAINKIGVDIFPDLIKVYTADNAAKSDYAIEKERPVIDQLQQLTRKILDRGDCLNVGQLAVNGNDLIRAGMKPGPELGNELSRLLDLVLEDPERNTREYLMSQIHVS